METAHIARIIGGSPRAFLAAARIAEKMSNYDLSRATSQELRAAGGITEKQADCLAAGIALASSIASNPLKLNERFANSRDIFNRYRAGFLSSSRETFICLYLNSKNCLIKESIISIGSLSTSIVHPREVFTPAVHVSAAAMICLHNHPSGDSAPSREDRECTQRLFNAGKLLGINLLDHIVLGFEDYFSFADAGLLTTV
jgi:DNA repair protein RadC